MLEQYPRYKKHRYSKLEKKKRHFSSIKMVNRLSCTGRHQFLFSYHETFKRSEESVVFFQMQSERQTLPLNLLNLDSLGWSPHMLVLEAPRFFHLPRFGCRMFTLFIVFFFCFVRRNSVMSRKLGGNTMMVLAKLMNI